MGKSTEHMQYIHIIMKYYCVKNKSLGIEKIVLCHEVLSSAPGHILIVHVHYRYVCSLLLSRQSLNFNKEVYVDFVAVQIKFLSFLAYIIRVYQVVNNGNTH